MKEISLLFLLTLLPQFIYSYDRHNLGDVYTLSFQNSTVSNIIYEVSS